MKRREYDKRTYRRSVREIIGRGYLCKYCKVRRADTLDHVPPLSLYPDGGWHGALVPACRSCNSRRGGISRQMKQSRQTGTRIW